MVASPSALASLLLVLTPSAAVATEEPIQNWLDGYADATDTGIGKAICVAPDGHLYATGQTADDVVLRSLTSAGTERWTLVWDSGGFDAGYAIAADATSNLYVAAESRPPGGGYAFTVLSANSSGQLRFVYSWPAATGLQWASDVKVGPDGNIYAAGQGSANPGVDAPNMAAVGLTPDGYECWRFAHRDRRNRGGNAWNLAVDDQAQVYLFGEIDNDFAVLGLEHDGRLRWTRRHDGGRNDWDKAEYGVLGEDGHLYAAGRTSTWTSERTFTAISFTTEGEPRWIYEYDGSGGSHDVATTVHWGLDDNVYVGGKTVETSGDAFTVISLTPGGDERWVFAPTWEGFNGVWSVTTDHAGNAYAAGFIAYRRMGFGMTRFGVAAIDPQGRERWRYVPPESDNSGIADRIVFDGNATLYAVGFRSGRPAESNLTVASLATGTALTLHGADPGRAGAINTFSVSGATPGGAVGFVYGLEAGSTEVPQCPGLLLGIDDPVQVGFAPADAQGEATLQGFVPEPAAGRRVLISVIDGATCAASNLMALTFE